MARFQFGIREKACINDIAKGMKIAAVARKHGVHRCTLFRWLRRDEVQEYLEIKKMEAEAETLRMLETQLDSPNPWVAQRAAFKIFDMVMPKPKPEVQYVFVKD